MRKIEFLRHIAEAFFFDRCRVEGYAEEETQWGELRQTKHMVFENMPCRLTQAATSQKKEDILWNKSTEASLLYPSAFHIDGGSDVAVTTEDGRESIFIAGTETVYYPTHKEVKILQREKA
jgi:hypothetical protein